VAAAPTAEEVIAASRVDFPLEGYPDAESLEPIVLNATDWLTYITGRRYSDTQTDEYAEIERTMDLAVRMRTEQIVMQSRADNVETAGDFDLLTSFSAGAYSESRRELARPKADQRPLNPWPALNDLLWLLLGLYPGEVNQTVTDRMEYWEELLGADDVAPAWEIIEVNWGRGMGLEPWGAERYWPGSLGVIPPVG
jgi:hypothetical protein